MSCCEEEEELESEEGPPVKIFGCAIEDDDDFEDMADEFSPEHLRAFVKENQFEAGFHNIAKQPYLP